MHDSLFSAAVFNLSAPPVVYEQNSSFSAMISLTAPSGGTTFQIEIDIMERGITATPFGESLVIITKNLHVTTNLQNAQQIMSNFYQN